MYILVCFHTLPSFLQHVHDLYMYVSVNDFYTAYMYIQSLVCWPFTDYVRLVSMV